MGTFIMRIVNALMHGGDSACLFLFVYTRIQLINMSVNPLQEHTLRFWIVSCCELTGNHVT